MNIKMKIQSNKISLQGLTKTLADKECTQIKESFGLAKMGDNQD